MKDGNAEQNDKVVRRSIVGVVGSGEKKWEERAGELGGWLAMIGVHLLTGGGGGVMASVSKGFSEIRDRKGLVIGIIPCQSAALSSIPKNGYPNPWVEIPVATHLPMSGEQGMDPLSRNHIVVLSSDVIVILPGGPGTLSEATLAVRYERPVVAYLNSPDELPGLPGSIPVVGSLDAVKEYVVAHI